MSAAADQNPPPLVLQTTERKLKALSFKSQRTKVICVGGWMDGCIKEDEFS